MNGDGLTRRHFLRGSGSLAGAAALRSALPGLAALTQAACSARDAAAAFENLTNDEAAEFEAIAARIIPTTETPGAREAGVIWFIDKAAGSFMAPALDELRAGLVEFRAALAAVHPGVERFGELPEVDQDAFLGTRDSTAFFASLRYLTVLGMFGMPSYGGNRDHIGSKLVGLDPGRHAHEPPFGYYDAEYRREHGDGD